MHFCSPLCGACPTVLFQVACPECKRIVLGAVEKCSQCGATLPKVEKFCECHEIMCDRPCRHLADPKTKGKKIACRKVTPNTAVREALEAARASAATNPAAGEEVPSGVSAAELGGAEGSQPA